MSDRLTVCLTGKEKPRTMAGLWAARMLFGLCPSAYGENKQCAHEEDDGEAFQDHATDHGVKPCWRGARALQKRERRLALADMRQRQWRTFSPM